MIDAFEKERQLKKNSKHSKVQKLSETNESKGRKANPLTEQKQITRTQKNSPETSANKSAVDKNKKNVEIPVERVTTTSNYLSEYANSITHVECVYKNENDELMGLVRYNNNKQGTVLVSLLKSLAPIHLIDYYESKLVFSESKDDNKI